MENRLSYLKWLWGLLSFWQHTTHIPVIAVSALISNSQSAGDSYFLGATV